MKFIKSNYIYLLWFLLYFMLAWGLNSFTPDSLLFLFSMYSISISLALSPVGEWVLRKLENVRPLQTREEKQAENIFLDVYESALEENPKLNKKIKLYITDNMTVNAFAIGRKTVVLTKGAISTFTEEELQGVIAHELGHISYGHTKALLLSIIGNLYFSILGLCFKLFYLLIKLLFTVAFASIDSEAHLITSAVLFINKFVVEKIVFIFMYSGLLLMSINSRSNEYQADKFAYNIGYGEDLTSALYILQKISMQQKMSILERLKSSHPHLADRIERLEYYEDLQGTA